MEAVGSSQAVNYMTAVPWFPLQQSIKQGQDVEYNGNGIDRSSANSSSPPPSLPPLPAQPGDLARVLQHSDNLRAYSTSYPVTRV